MRLNTKAFTKEIEWTTRFIGGTRCTIPVLQNVLIELTENGVVRLTATDLETAGVSELCAPLPHDGAWKLAVPAKQLLKYLKRLDTSEVSVSALDPHTLVIETDDCDARIPGLSAESFPELPIIPLTRSLSGLTEALPRVTFAISQEESRFTLNGALLEVKNGAAHFVSTDGHRLSYVNVAVDGLEPLRVLVPRVTLDEVARLKADTVCFGRDDNHVRFSAGDRSIISRVLTGNFPDYERVLPAEFDHSVMLPAEKTGKILDRVALFADERSQCVKVAVKAGECFISAETCESGKACGFIPCETNGTDWHTGLSATYVQEYLKRAPDSFAFRFSDPKKPTFAKPDWVPGANTSAVEFTTDNWRYVLMPMRI